MAPKSSPPTSAIDLATLSAKLSHAPPIRRSRSTQTSPTYNPTQLNNDKPKDTDMTAGNNDEVKHPSRADRQNCWKVRDAYFECLNNANIIDPSKPEAANVCQDLRSLYEKGCMKSWVDYFNKRRVLEVEQKELLERMRAQHKAVEERAAAAAEAAKAKGSA